MKKERIVVDLPNSIEEAQEQLGGLGRLLTAKSWERAAIVHAFTEDKQGTRSDLETSSRSTGSSLSITAFAELGINGLKSDKTVRLYRNLWAEHGDPDIGPGSTVVLPDVDFPPTRTGTDGMNTADNAVKKILDLPEETQGKVAEGLARKGGETIEQGISLGERKRTADKMGRKYEPEKAVGLNDKSFEDTDMGLWAVTTEALSVAQRKLGIVISQMEASQGDLNEGTNELIQRDLDKLQRQLDRVRELARINVEAQL